MSKILGAWYIEDILNLKLFKQCKMRNFKGDIFKVNSLYINFTNLSFPFLVLNIFIFVAIFYLHILGVK